MLAAVVGWIALVPLPGDLTLPDDMPAWAWVVILVASLWIKEMIQLVRDSWRKARNGKGTEKLASRLDECGAHAVAEAVREIGKEHRGDLEASEKRLSEAHREIVKVLEGIARDNKDYRRDLSRAIAGIEDANRTAVRYLQVVVAKEEKLQDGISELKAGQTVIQDRIPRPARGGG